MVRIPRLNEFLRPEHLQGGDVLEIVNEGEYRSAEETPFGRAVFQIGVRLPNGDTKIWTVNRTTLRRLAEAWGDETEHWVGKKVKVKLVEQNVRGELKKVIYGFPVEGEAPEVSERVTLTLTKEEAEKIRRLLGRS